MGGAAPPPAGDGQPAPGGSKGNQRAWILVAGLLLAVTLAAVGGALIGSWRGTPAVDPSASPAVVGPAGPSPVSSPSPDRSPSPSPVVATTPTPGVGSTYTVEPGDTLRSIAEAVYGDPEAWTTLYEANREAIGADPDAVQAGTTLRVPPR